MAINSANNIILTGFMASGKSAIGRMLSQIYSYKLIDLDHIIEKDQQKTINQIFKENGESYFRALELDLINSLQNVQNSVIVCGGGTSLQFLAYEKLKNLGKIFFLDTPFAYILERLEKKPHKRPLAKEISNLENLYFFRKPFYEATGYRIDTSHEDQETTCAQIAAVFNAHKKLSNVVKIPVNNAHKKYTIYLEKNLLSLTKDILEENALGDFTPVIITSDRLAKIFASKITQIEKSLSMACEKIIIEDGEQSKNLQTFELILQQLFAKNFTRKTLIIALGGGVIGDLSGFCASTFLRGVPFIQIPTTLLAMVDSSIGGKTGIDTPEGKNLIGSFYNPSAVIIDPNFLESLPQEEFSCGMAEIIKHAIIADEDLFYELLKNDLDILSVIKRAILVKQKIVQRDPFENNIRAHLNLGHTFAHAIEKLSDYKVKHGQAVAIGLVFATKFAKEHEIQNSDFLKDLLTLLHKFNLPTTLPFKTSSEAFLAAMKHDKKHDNKGLKLILPITLGKKIFYDYVDKMHIESFLKHL